MVATMIYVDDVTVLCVGWPSTGSFRVRADSVLSCGLAKKSVFFCVHFRNVFKIVFVFWLSGECNKLN